MRVRRNVRTGVLVIAALLLAGWLIPPLFRAGRYRKAVQAALESQLGLPVDVGAVRLRLLPRPGFSIQNVSVQEEPRFGAEPLTQVRSVECDLRWRSLWSSHFSCATIVLNDPLLNLVRNSSGEWNIEAILHRPSAAPRTSLGGASSSPAAPISFQIDNGRIDFTLNGTKKPFALNAVAASIEFNRSNGNLDFRIQGTPVRTDLPLLQAPGPVLVTGEWKPADRPGGALHARLTTRDSLLYAWVPLITHRDLGIYGLVAADIQFSGSARKLRITGGMRIAQLHGWESLPPESPQTVELGFSGLWNRAANRVEVQRVDASFSQSHLRLSGQINSLSRDPRYLLSIAIRNSRVENFMGIGNSIVRRPAGLSASGRLDGDVTLDGSWPALRYGGLLVLRSLAIRRRGIEVEFPEADIRISDEGARLLPTRFTVASSIEGNAEGALIPALPLGARPPGAVNATKRLASRSAGLADSDSRYELHLELTKVPLARVVRLARSWGVHGLRNVDATGAADASIRIFGPAWPFRKPEVSGEGIVESARLLVAGLTEPVQIKRFPFRIAGDVFSASDIAASVGPAQFSGWIKRGSDGQQGWQFEARSPHLSLEQASLWFAALGYRPPRPILDLIPGLRSLTGNREASRNLFATINTRGEFQSPDVTFRSLALRKFRASVAISGRVARVSDAQFQLAGGQGIGSGEVDFREVPARVTAQFNITGLRIKRIAAVLPPDLRNVRGALSAAVRLSTRGLRRAEMAARLQGAAEITGRHLTLQGFDPIAAAARAGSFGDLVPELRPPILPAVDMKLVIGRGALRIVPTRVLLSGAVFTIDGQCGFGGTASLDVLADLNRVERRWILDPPASSPGDRVVRLHLAGPFRNLSLEPLARPAEIH